MADVGDPPEEEKEEEAIVPETIGDAFRKLVDEQDFRPFESGSFNVRSLSDDFINNSRSLDDDVFLNQRGAKAIFETELKDVLRQAFALPTVLERDNAIKGIFSTLGRVTSNTSDSLAKSPEGFIEDILKKEFSFERFQALEGRIFQPVDVPDLINTLFAADLNDIQKRSLSVPEITAIRDQFKVDLAGLEDAISRNEGDFVFGQNTFRMLQQYIQEHVENAQLKQLLLGDIQQQIAASRQSLGLRLGEAPPRIVPLSATRVSVLRGTVNEQIGTILRKELETIDTAQARILAAPGRSPTVQIRKQRTRVLAAVRSFNEFVQRNEIRNPRTGLLVTIATEEAPQFSQAAQRALLTDPVQRRLVTVRGVPVEDLIRQLNDLSNIFLGNKLAFEHVPMTIRDMATGQSRDAILDGIRKLDQTLTRRRLRGFKSKKVLSEGLGKRAKFPNIDILQARRRRQQIKADKVERFGAKPRHITIKADVTLAELAKIANMIIMESGSLEDESENPILDIVKGVTTIQQVLTVLMEEMKQSAGNDYMVIYVPNNFFGGMFLDGPMEVLHTARMLASPVGGDIFSSIFSTIGNVVKTVASVPLAIAGSVFGGQLPAQEKPLFVNGGIQRPLARANTFPQTGGRLTQQSFIQGERQPEPNINRSQNQQFHIQPFPFGGRIDNTGYIDQSQVNPLFGWAMQPVRNLTYYR